MLKRLLLSAAILSAVGVSSYAVDVNIPGADPSISKDVYVQGVYSTENIKNAYDVETRKIIDSIISKKGIHKRFGTAVNDDEVESFKNDLYSIKRRQFDGNTIVNLHNDNGGVSVTLPFSGIQKEAITDFPNSNAHYLVESPMIAAGVIENKTPNTTDKTDVAFNEEIFRSPQHPYTQSLLAAVPRLGEMRGQAFTSITFPCTSPGVLNIWNASCAWLIGTILYHPLCKCGRYPPY